MVMLLVRGEDCIECTMSVLWVYSALTMVMMRVSGEDCIECTVSVQCTDDGDVVLAVKAALSVLWVYSVLMIVMLC